MTGNENETGWYKFATYNFKENVHNRTETLLHISNYNPGEKFIALVEINIDQTPSGYNELEGIVLKQLSGNDITQNLAYHLDYDTKNITFYVRKTNYQIIRINILRNVGSNANANILNVATEKDTNNRYKCYETITITSNGVYANMPTTTGKDDKGNIISETYATKDEIVDLINAILNGEYGG